MAELVTDMGSKGLMMRVCDNCGWESEPVEGAYAALSQEVNHAL